MPAAQPHRIELHGVHDPVAERDLGKWSPVRRDARVTESAELVAVQLDPKTTFADHNDALSCLQDRFKRVSRMKHSPAADFALDKLPASVAHQRVAPTPVEPQLARVERQSRTVAEKVRGAGPPHPV